MSPIPLYHLSPIGRAVIDVESARIKQELAARRSERESRQQPLQVHDDMDQSTLPLTAAAAAADLPAEGVEIRP
jgi:hypothetical protein